MNTVLPYILLSYLLQGFVEPSWATAAFQDKYPEFGALRKKLDESKVFPTPGEARGAAEAARQTKSATSVFRALYLSVASADVVSNSEAYVDLWKQLPESEYEVIRLRYLWDRNPSHKLSSLGRRLLDRNGNDVPVLCRLVIQKTYRRSDQDVASAKLYAERALKVQQSASTFYAYAWSKMYRKDGKPVPESKADGRIAKEYFRKYLNAPGPKPMKHPAKGLIKWLEDRGY